MARRPHRRVLTGADLVVDLECVKVSLGAKIQHSQRPRGHESHQVAIDVIARYDKAGRKTISHVDHRNNLKQLPSPGRAFCNLSGTLACRLQLDCLSLRMHPSTARHDPPLNSTSLLLSILGQEQFW